MDIEKINVGGTQYDVCDTVARAALSDEFSTGGTYAVGDYCIYENTLYKFTAAKEPGAWDASKVAATQIGDELSQLNGKIKFGSRTFTIQTTETTYNIEFGEPFSSSPAVIISILRSGYAASTSIVLRNVSTSGFSFTAVSDITANAACTVFGSPLLSEKMDFVICLTSIITYSHIK